jgi:hypothetical protein
VAEICAARKAFPSLCSLKVSDDCPTCKPEHFKTFLRLLAEEDLCLNLCVDNMRADRVDDELVELAKAAGASELCLGAEHGNPQVFELINKGEEIDDIRRAAAIIKAHGLDLGLCFVIGLPGDTFKRTGDSIRLAREIDASNIFWNMAHPFPGTDVHQWFVSHGAMLDLPRTYTSYDLHQVDSPEPVVETPEFSKLDRRRAYFWAVTATDQYILTRASVKAVLRGIFRYRIIASPILSLIRRLPREFFRRVREHFSDVALRAKRDAGK